MTSVSATPVDPGKQFQQAARGPPHLPQADLCPHNKRLPRAFCLMGCKQSVFCASRSMPPHQRATPSSRPCWQPRPLLPSHLPAAQSAFLFCAVMRSMDRQPPTEPPSRDTSDTCDCGPRYCGATANRRISRSAMGVATSAAPPNPMMVMPEAKPVLSGYQAIRFFTAGT